MPDQIFISYRRDDAAYVTGHINDLLRKEFGSASVFTDVDNIALGVDFRMVLDQSVSQCQVLLAVIGDNWLTVRNKDGMPRLHDPADFVRIEIESALKRNIPVIPLLVSGAAMPLEEDLPDSLKDLAFRNGTQIRPAPDFSVDVDRLIRNLRIYLQSIRENAGDEAGINLATETSRSDETEQQELHADTAVHRDSKTKRSNTSQERMLVGEDERARKQVELGIGHHPGKKRWATRLSLMVILAVAGGSWYYADQNPEKLQAVLTAVQTEPSETEENLVTREDAESNRMEDTASTGEGTGDTVTTLTAYTMGAAEDDSAAIPESAAEIDAATNPAASSTNETSETTDTTLQVDADMAAGFTADAIDEAGDNAAVNFTEDAETAPDPATYDEVILTPGSQRQADASEYIREGVSLAATGDHAAAIQNFDEAIQLDVQPAFVHSERGASYQALGEYEAAVRDYDEAIRLNGEDVNAYYDRGASHFALEDFSAAIADYDAVIRLDPEFADAYSKRADAHEAVGNDEAAARDRSVAAVFQSQRE